VFPSPVANPINNFTFVTQVRDKQFSCFFQLYLPDMIGRAKNDLAYNAMPLITHANFFITFATPVGNTCFRINIFWPKNIF